MYSTNTDTILEEINAKVNEILPLVKELAVEDRQLVKKFLTDRVHEIFLELDKKQNSALELDQNESNSQVYNQTRSSEHISNPLIVESNAIKPLSDSNSIESREILATEISEIPVFSDYKLGATSESESVKISDLPLKSSENFVTPNFSSNQYLSMGIGNPDVPQGEQHTNIEINDFKIGGKEDSIADAAVSAESTYNVTDDLDNDEATQQLMDEIDDIKPKSNLPFVKDGTPDTTYTTASEDVSSLLSFLPQLSPYIKFDLRDTTIGEKEGYIHLTVEKADGSVQNLKLAATAASPEECAKYDNQRTLKSNCGDKQLSLIQKDLMNKENDLYKGENSPKESPQPETLEEKDMAGNQRSRGRPRKQEIYHSKVLESGQKVFVCNICKSSAQTQHAMTVHMRKHSGEKPFTCSVCEKSFTTKGNLKNHSITHREDKPWNCPYCDKTFKEKRVLLTHQRIHTGEKPFKCTLCERSFTQSGVLKEHLLVHSGQKPHLCDLCGQDFRGLSSLRAHKLRHLQRKDFKCDKCEKDFICKADLTRHYMTHTGSRPFMCSLCPKSFTRLNYLKEHLNGHYGNKPFSCSECSATFSDSVSLHRHRRKHKVDKDDLNKPTIQNPSELQKQLIMDTQSTKVAPTNLPSFEIMQQTQLGDQSFQFVLDENTTMEDIQKLQSLLSSTTNSDVSTGPDPAQPPAAQPMYQVMCMNPDTQEIVAPNRNDQVVVEGSSAYLSAINMLANATTSQQYSFSIQ